MDSNALVKKSKHLSKVLRHDPASAGITLTEAGWAPTAAILAYFKLSKEDLDQVVEENNKKRFEYTEDGMFIRARQGHSVEVNLGYPEAVPPDILYHGTSRQAVPNISIEGLKKMLRHHVHLSPDLKTAQVVAARSIPQVTLKNCHRFVVIPTKHCVNLAAAVYLVLYDRQMKMLPDLTIEDCLSERRFDFPENTDLAKELGLGSSL